MLLFILHETQETKKLNHEHAKWGVILRSDLVDLTSLSPGRQCMQLHNLASSRAHAGGEGDVHAAAIRFQSQHPAAAAASASVLRTACVGARQPSIVGVCAPWVAQSSARSEGSAFCPRAAAVAVCPCATSVYLHVCACMAGSHAFAWRTSMAMCVRAWIGQRFTC